MTNDDPDRDAIQAAADRLLAGLPLRSTGELTIVQLAHEAGLKRWLLTHKHRDLAEQFQAKVRAAGGDPPAVTEPPWIFRRGNQLRSFLFGKEMGNGDGEAAQVVHAGV